MLENWANTDNGTLKIAVIMGIGIVLAIGLITMMCRTPADSEAIILSTPGLQKHDQFCMSLPRPADFQVLYKMVGGNSRTTAITYWYSSKLRAADVQSFFVREMPSLGWRSTTNFDNDHYSSFVKDDYQIVVSLECAVCDSSRYTVDCSQTQK